MQLVEVVVVMLSIAKDLVFITLIYFQFNQISQNHNQRGAMSTSPLQATNGPVGSPHALNEVYGA